MFFAFDSRLHLHPAIVKRSILRGGEALESLAPE
jgi:hypothetical protein